MFKLSIGTGIILTVLGLGGYVMSGGASPTALIPAAFGILFIVFGYLARKESMRRHAMHGAALLSLLGIIGSFKGTIAAVTMLGGGVVERPQAAIAQAIMARDVRRLPGARRPFIRQCTPETRASAESIRNIPCPVCLPNHPSSAPPATSRRSSVRSLDA